jgi:hypothetical protein
VGINNRQRRAAKKGRRRGSSGGGGRGPWPGGGAGAEGASRPGGGPSAREARPGGSRRPGFDPGTDEVLSGLQQPWSDDPWSDETWATDPWSDDDDPWDGSERWVGDGHCDECERLEGGGDEREDAAGTLRSLLVAVLSDPRAATRYATSLLGGQAPESPQVVTELLREDLVRSVTVVVQHGWLPSDLMEVTRRRVTEDAVAAVAGLLHAELDKHPVDRVADAWRDDLGDLGEAADLALDSVEGLATGLRLDALLTVLPVIATLVPPPGSAARSGSTGGQGSGTAGMDTRVLARVRALLGKAESTEFPEEAEALSAKAQELISRYALDRLWVDEPRHDPAMVRSRLWIDPPYVMPKAVLVGAVAEANRCRSVVTEDPGFCTLVGTAADLEAVEVLATSLLVQASAAMTRHGAQVDLLGRSRTRSFRHAFLLSYATRIGERLRAATESAAADSGRSTDLVPLLRRHAQRVDAAVDETFPHLQSRQSSVSNGLGWAAGRAAADLARLDLRGEVTRESG